MDKVIVNHYKIYRLKIQDLEQQRLQRIEYDRSTNMVRLTDEGVQWARKECDKLPYLDYK